MKSLTNEQVKFLQELSEKTEKLSKLSAEKGLNGYVMLCLSSTNNIVGKLEVNDIELVKIVSLQPFKDKEAIDKFFEEAFTILLKSKKEILEEYYNSKIKEL